MFLASLPSVQSMERSMTLYVAERVRPASPANGDPTACISQADRVETRFRGVPKGSLVIAGPDVALAPKAGLALAMAVHELASNAAKYGALSTVSGASKSGGLSPAAGTTRSWHLPGQRAAARRFRRQYGAGSE